MKPIDENARPILILASQSPRRHELLEQMGIAFTVRVADVDERVDLQAREAVAVLAQRKAWAVANSLEGGVVLAADTLVALDGAPMGKPRDAAQAEDMLRSLSGRAHDVFTGICLVNAKTRQSLTHVERTQVSFRPLSDEEIHEYVATGEPMDKAGTYGIQGGAGAFVASIDGSYENVMGLPVQALERILDDFLCRGLGG